jgi:hypothetical protein
MIEFKTFKIMDWVVNYFSECPDEWLAIFWNENIELLFGRMLRLSDQLSDGYINKFPAKVSWDWLRKTL